MSSGIESRLLTAMFQNSAELAQAYERMPPDARELYAVTVEALRRELALLPLATGLQESQQHKDTIAQLQSTLDSLDAVSKIRLFHTTLNVLQVLAVTAIKVALASV